MKRKSNEDVVSINSKRLFDTKELASYMSCGKTKAREFADRCGATRRFGRSVLFDRIIIDHALDDLANQEKMKKGRKTQSSQKKSTPEAATFSRAGVKISSKDIKWLEEITVNHKIPEFVICRAYGKKEFKDLTIDDVKEFKRTGKAFLDKWDEDHK